MFARFPAAFLSVVQLAWGLPALAADTLRTPQEAETRTSGLEESLRPAADPRPNRVVFEIYPSAGRAVKMSLPTGEEVQFRVRNGRVEIAPGADMAGGVVTYRDRSLQPGAVFAYTLSKTERALLKIQAGDIHWRPVEERVYFFPLEMVNRLLVEETDLELSPERWRAQAPYVFSDLGRREDGAFLVELRYRDLPASVQKPPVPVAAGLEEDFEAMLAKAPGVVLTEKGAESSDGLVRFDFEGNVYLGIYSAGDLDGSPDVYGALRVVEAVFGRLSLRGLVVAQDEGETIVASDGDLGTPLIKEIEYRVGSADEEPVLVLRMDPRARLTPQEVGVWAQKDEQSGPIPLTLRLEKTSAGLEERWQGMRSAAAEMRSVVIGRSVVERFPALRALAGLEEHFLVDEGADTVVRLAERGASSVTYYGGPEESGAFAALAGEALISVEAHSSSAPEFLVQLREILTLAGISQDILTSGLEEFAAELDSLAVGV